MKPRPVTQRPVTQMPACEREFFSPACGPAPQVPCGLSQNIEPAMLHWHDVQVGAPNGRTSLRAGFSTPTSIKCIEKETQCV